MDIEEIRALYKSGIIDGVQASELTFEHYTKDYRMPAIIANPPKVEIISLEVRCPYCNCPWITPYGSCMGCGNMFMGTVAPVYGPKNEEPQFLDGGYPREPYPRDKPFENFVQDFEAIKYLGGPSIRLCDVENCMEKALKDQVGKRLCRYHAKSRIRKLVERAVGFS